MSKKMPTAEQINNVVGIVKSAKQLKMRHAILAGRALIIDHTTSDGKSLIKVCEENNVPYIHAADVYQVEL